MADNYYGATPSLSYLDNISLGKTCNCNTVCSTDENGEYMCHLKAAIYAPIQGLSDYIDSHQAEFIGRNAEEVKTELKNQFPKLRAEILPIGREPARIKVVASQRAVIRVGEDGKVTQVHGL